MFARQLRAVLVASRPRQWVKNIALFAPIVFGGQLFHWDLLWRALLGFIAFCFISSSNYLLNDILDVSKDRKHPFKKYRPVASRDLPENLAIVTAMFLAIGGLSIGALLGTSFLLIVVSFLILHWCLFFLLRRIRVIDVLAIASGYVLRVAAGEAATGYDISVWLFLVVLSFSLLLAIGKRRAELTLLQSYGAKTFSEDKSFLYSGKLLDAYVTVFANATFLTYAYFAFLVAPQPAAGVFDYLDRKWMMVTIPFVLYGILRYLQLIYENKRAVLEKVVTSDIPLLTTLSLWVLTVLIIVYGVRG